MLNDFVSCERTKIFACDCRRVPESQRLRFLQAQVIDWQGLTLSAATGQKEYEKEDGRSC